MAMLNNTIDKALTGFGHINNYEIKTKLNKIRQQEVLKATIEEWCQKCVGGRGSLKRQVWMHQ